MKFILISIIFSLASALPAHAINSREMANLASALTHVSSAIQATIKVKNPSNQLSGKELLRLSVAHDPALLRPFNDYEIDVIRHGKFAIVLICDERETMALLEDITCTAQIDKNHWRNFPKTPCRSTYSQTDILYMNC